MKVHRVLCLLALGAASLVACGGDDDDDAVTGDRRRRRGTREARPTPRPPRAATPAAATTSATRGGGGGGGELEMWERSGGNAPMVDALVAAWNEENPDRQINLTYIPHAEMVPKLAQAIASGDVPDLMGLDLIYGPQFAAGRPARGHHRPDRRRPALETIPEGHRTVATWEDRLYGVPLYADVSVLFWNKELFRQAGLDPEQPPTNLTELHDMAAADHRPRRRQLRLLPAGQLRRLQHLHVRPDDLGVRRQDRAGRVRRRGARRREHPRSARVGADDAPGGPDRSRPPSRRTARRSPRCSARARSGSWAPGTSTSCWPRSRTPTSTSASPCSPGWRAARSPRSPAATSSPCPRAPSASTTRSTSCASSSPTRSRSSSTPSSAT